MAREVRFGVRLTGDAKGAVNAMHMTDRELKKLGREMRKSDRSVRNSRREWSQWGNGIMSVRRLLGPLAGIGGVSVLARTTRNVIANTAALSEAADVGGVTAETYQELTKAFSDLGGVSDNITGGALRRFNRRLGLADQGTGAAKDTFDELGIAIRGVDGEMRATDTVLREALRTLEGMENEAQRAAFASQMFGDDAGPRLAAALSQGTGALDQHIAKLREQGRVLDNETVANARAANDQLNEMRDIIGTRFNQQILDNADSYMRMAEGLATVAEKGLEALSVLSDISKWAGEEVAARTGGIAGDDIARLEQERDRIMDMMGGGIAGAGRRLRFFGRDGLVSYYSEDELRQELARIDAQIAQHYSQPPSPPGGADRNRPPPPVLDPRPSPDAGNGDAPTSPSDPGPSRFLTDEIQRQVDLMREQIALYQELEAEGRSVYENTRTPLEQLNVEMARLDELLDAGVISWDTYTRAVFDAEERLGGFTEQNKEAASEISEFWLEAARSMQRSMSDLFFGVMQGELGDLAGNFKRTIDRMVADLLASQLLEFLGNSMSGAGGWVGAVGQVISSFDGGGHTGSGPRVGGVDGKGGFPAILHPNETVIDHTRASGAGAGAAPITVNVNVSGIRDEGGLSRASNRVAADAARAVQRARRDM